MPTATFELQNDLILDQLRGIYDSVSNVSLGGRDILLLGGVRYECRVEFDPSRAHPWIVDFRYYDDASKNVLCFRPTLLHALVTAYDRGLDVL